MTQPQQEADYLLRKARLFAGLSDSDLDELSPYVYTTQLVPEQWLFQEGDIGDACYIVVSGLIRLVVGHGSAEETSLALQGPGGFFGELSLLQPEGRRTAGAVAVEPSLLLTIPAVAFDTLLLRHPTVVLDMLRQVAFNQRLSDERSIKDLRRKNDELTKAYKALEAAQAEALRRARLARELELARDLQRSLLPHELPSLPSLHCTAASFPAFEMSGDFYDVHTDDENRLTIVMADVCDKGAQAAMVMALTKGMLLASSDTGSALATVQRTNALLCATGIASAVVTLVYAVLDMEHNTLRYVRAGHEWPLLYRAATASVTTLEAAGMPMGIVADALLEEDEVPLQPGDILVFYTDGLTEARSPAGDEYGRDRLIAAVRAYGNLSADRLADALLGDVRAWQGSAPPNDDLTLLVIQLR